MNILSVIVPSYNSENYLEHCVNTILDSGDGIEILIVNDGSIDKTGSLADRFETEYPGRVRALHQVNLGHGGAVNTGIQAATGKYIKVVDSDDWVNSHALKAVVNKLKEMIRTGNEVDMFLADFMYDKVGETNKTIMHYKGIIPKEKIITWDEVGHFKPGKYILMHSVIYKKDVLLASQLKLPEHTFYVDNLFVYQPIPYVKTLYYMNLCVYHYFIGRDDQSVNEKNMIKRIDQQLFVNRMMLECTNLEAVEESKKKKYMMHYLTIVTTVSSILLMRIGTKEALAKKKELWQAIRNFDYSMYLKMRTTLIGGVITLPGHLGRKISLFIYEKARARVGFN